MSSNKLNNGTLGPSMGSSSGIRGDDEDLGSLNRTLVSDALAKNSRQLLYAHLYNYLIENKLYDTARILLQEADVPVSNLRKNGMNGDDGSTPKFKIGDDDELPGVKMLMTSPDTFLLEWWQSLWALHSHVRDTNMMQQQRMNMAMPGSAGGMPMMPNGMGAPGANFDYSKIVQQQQQAQQQQAQQQQSMQQAQKQSQQPQQPSSNASHSMSPVDNNDSSPAVKPQGPMSSQPPQTLQSPLPHSGNGTPHSSGITAPSPHVTNPPPQGMHQGNMQQRPTPLGQQPAVGPSPQHPVPPQQQQQQPGQFPQQPHPGAMQQQPQPWQVNKMQQMDIQQRVQLQKAHLNNQLQNFANLPPQQQLLLQQQQQRLNQQAQAMHPGRMMAGHQQGAPQQPGNPQQFVPMMPQQQPMMTPTMQQQPPQSQPQQPQQQQQQQQQQQVQPGQQGAPMPPPNGKAQLPYAGQRGDNHAALHDYQMQLMMLENQTKLNGPPQQRMGPPQSGGAAAAAMSDAGQKSRGQSIAIDPLQPDPLQMMELFPGDMGGAQWKERGSISGGNLDDLVGFNGELNF